MYLAMWIPIQLGYLNNIEQHLLITANIDKSLSLGIFPTAVNCAIVTPLIKKPYLEKEVLKNNRPVSNLSFVAKVIEKCTATQLVENLNASNLTDPLQSAYRSLHCTETAMIKVLSDIVSDMDSRRVVFVVLLDMSAAFDTVNHKILVDCFENRYAISGTANAWFESYLKGWATQVSISGTVLFQILLLLNMVCHEGLCLAPCCLPVIQILLETLCMLSI